MNEGRLEEERQEDRIYDRKKYVDLITYTYSNTDREFNWLTLFRGSCTREVFSIYLSKTNSDIEAALHMVPNEIYYVL